MESIVANTSLKVDFGGGLKSNEDVITAFEYGATQITGGTIAVSDPQLFSQWIEKYGPQKIILGADCNQKKIATNGWQESSGLEVVDFIQHYKSKGIQKVINQRVQCSRK